MINEFYSLDSAIVLALIKDFGLPIAESLKLIPHIHNEYITILLEHREKEYGKQDN
jgi:hypothetical protein